MKTTIVQFNPQTANIEDNCEKITEFISKFHDSDLIIFPELSITGINCNDYFLEKDFINRQYNAIDTIVEHSSGKSVLIGIAERQGQKLYSSVLFISEGKEKIVCRKKILSKNEKKYFTDGYGSSDINCRGKLLTVTLDKTKECKSDILVNLSAENFQADNFQKRQMKRSFAEIRVNPVCLSGSCIYDGRSYFSDKQGNKLIVAPAFEETAVTFDEDFEYERIEEPEINIYDEVINALTFALKDFCRKIGFKKIVLGLSGGIDSALTAALAVKAVGKENVLGITMPSEFSSSGSVNDSIALAENLGIECKTIPIKSMFDCFVSDVQKERFYDLAEENLQSRLRALILMNYSNRHNALLLSTGNKSEVATGYCTLYGDTCGGFNLLSDIYKTDVYKISERINKDGEIIPRSTMTKPPSAELRPDQKDTDSLPDYPVLDKVIRLYFEQKLSVEDIEYLCPDAPVRQIVKTVLRAEFKRKQMTSGVKLSEYSFVSDIDYPVI